MPIQAVPEDFSKTAAIGVSRGTKLVAGFLYHRFNGFDCEVSIAVDDRSIWTNRSLIRVLFAYPFHQLGCTRLSCTVPVLKSKASKLADKLGFELEGLKRRGYDGINDAYVYGMLREGCRWLN